MTPHLARQFLRPLLCIVPLIIASSAAAGPSRIGPGEPYIDEFKGDANNLPVNCTTTPEVLVARARMIAGVQQAIQEFESRGYVAVPGADTAMSGCTLGIPASAVSLAYLKPGAFIDSFHVVAPSILVVTTLNTSTGEPMTTISGGLMVGDGEVGLVFSGDSLAAFRDTDHSFDVRRRITVEPENLWDTFGDPNSKFNTWMRCAGAGTIGCVGMMMRLGGPGLTRIKLMVILLEPEIGLALLEGCALAAAITCMASR